jgi:hypothetical protein
MCLAVRAYPSIGKLEVLNVERDKWAVEVGSAYISFFDQSSGLLICGQRWAADLG